MAAQAIAMHLLWQRRAGEVPDAALEAALARVIAALHASAAKAGATAEDLAFLVLAEDTRLRAGHTARHGEALALLLATEREEGFGTVADNAAALLALSRATTLLPADPRLAPAIARAIAALGSLDAPEDRDRALLLRALRAVQGARVAGVLVLEDAVREAAARLTAREESWLRQRVASPTDAGALRAALLLAQLAPDPLAMRVLPRDRAA